MVVSSYVTYEVPRDKKNNVPVVSRVSRPSRGSKTLTRTASSAYGPVWLLACRIVRYEELHGWV